MWEVLVSDEVEQWYMSLDEDDRALAERAIDRLEADGPNLRMPHAKYLKGKLWELRFRCEGVNRRVTYTIEGQVITLTTFRKQRRNESREIDRARAALARYRDGSREER